MDIIENQSGEIMKLSQELESVRSLLESKLQDVAI